MATILPGSPPAFQKNDVGGTVKALCAYTRNMHETMDYLLGQLEKDLSKLNDAVEAQGKTVSALQYAVNQQGDTIAAFQTSLASALQLMNQQYTQLSARVLALEQKGT